MSFVMLFLFAGLLVFGMPVGYALLIAAGGAILALSDVPITVVLLKLYSQTQSFPLVAIPFFILSGALLMSGVLGQQLVQFAARLVGRYRGGLGQVNVVGATIFGGVSGSAVADASALGAIVIPWMKREGYPGGIAAAINASCSILAVLIPPSIPLILFSTISNASINALFLAGILPGLMLAGGLMFTCWLVGVMRGLPIARIEGGLTRGLLLRALPALGLPILIIVFLRFGIATPTEVSAIAVAYALMCRICIYRDLSARKFIQALLIASATTGVVMLVIISSSLVSYVLTDENVPILFSQWVLGTLKEPWLIILMMNILMLIIGMFIDLSAAILLLGPIFVVLGEAIGMNMIQLGLMMTMNLAIGLFTPPVGTTMFISAAIARERIGNVVRELWPFYAVSGIVLLLISYVPAVTIQF